MYHSTTRGDQTVPPPERLPRIVVIGGGFGGLAAARALSETPADVIVVDRRNHNIFQPLLYQVATAVLAPSEVAAPIRQLARRQKNLAVVLGEAVNVDLDAQTVRIVHGAGEALDLVYDYLIVAAGTRPSYFGRDEFAAFAPSLKTLTDAEAIRAKILSAYEAAELADHDIDQQRLMTFVLVGAGPTGVELAASMAQMASYTLKHDFRRIDPARTTIILVEGGPRILPSFHESLSAKAHAHLEKIGVRVMTGAKVEMVDDSGVIVAGERIAAATVIWTAGVEAAPIIRTLATPKDRAGRVQVDPHLNIPDHPQVYVVGDAATLVIDGRPLPGVAQAALQMGRYAGARIAGALAGRRLAEPFRYRDMGNMAVVGKNFAVLETKQVRRHGFASWLAWALLHVMVLPQQQNRLRVQTQWFWTYLTGQRGSRLIPEAGQHPTAPAHGDAAQIPQNGQSPPPTGG